MPYDKPEIQSPHGSMAQTLDLVIREITICYQPPNTVKCRDDADMWIAAFGQAIVDETPDPAELAAAWREFRRQHVRGFWPTPGPVCQAIRDRRTGKRALTTSAARRGGKECGSPV